MVSYAPYAYGTIIRTIRVWLYHMCIRLWYVPYAYGTYECTYGTEQRNGIIHIPTELPIVTFNTSQTQGHNYKLNQLPERTNIYAKSFFPNSVKLWNNIC